MQKSYRKNILRDFKGNLSRFLSLFGIVALGVMILTGLVSFAPSMRIAGQKYYVEQNVFDLRILSALGLSEDDIAAISATDGVTAVEAVKYLDVEGHWSGTDEPAVLRVQQLPADPDADTAENMNRLVLQAGRMPEAADECVVHVMGHGEEVPLGTTLTLPDDTDGPDPHDLHRSRAGAGPAVFLRQPRDLHRRGRRAGCPRLCAGQKSGSGLLHSLLCQGQKCRSV